MAASDPNFFPRLAEAQTPRFLWIGCADSRVPADALTGPPPGDLFVHRNVANIVSHSDLNCLSVLQFAVDVLKVRYIIICGHSRCGGIKAALEGACHGLVDEWLYPVREIINAHRAELEAINVRERRLDYLCELNILHQITSTAETTIVQKAWRQRQSLMIHGWSYKLSDGLLHDLGQYLESDEELKKMKASYLCA